MKILKFNEGNDFKSFTEDEVNSFSKEDQKRLIIAYSDGGDTYMKDLEKLHKNSGYGPNDALVKSIDDLYEEYGGNRVEIGWIENNRLIEALVTQN